MAEEYQIRAARLRDAESIFALIRQNRDQLVPRSKGNIVENIDLFVVATCGNDIVGCVTYQVHPKICQPEAATVEIQSVAVRAPYRRKGIGRLVINAVIEKVSPFSCRRTFKLFCLKYKEVRS